MTEVAGIADFDSIVAVYRAKVFRFALASLRDPDAANTITQDCFMRVFQSRGAFRGDCSLNTWIMQIAVNLVRDHVRNRRLQFWRNLGKRSNPLELASETLAGRERSPEVQVVLKEQVRAVWEAAAKLPERQRTVFLLRFVEDMDVLEIAAATGLAEGTVKVHLFRALDAVRKRVGKR